MPATVRMSKEEEKKIREKCIEFNKILIAGNLMPYKESELVHKILEIALSNVKMNKQGSMFFE